jgi:hypothetical protein
LLGDQGLQSRLEERRVTIENCLYFASIDIDSDNAKTELSKTGGGDATNVSETENANRGLIRHKGILCEFLVSGFWLQLASFALPARWENSVLFSDY